MGSLQIPLSISFSSQKSLIHIGPKNKSTCSLGSYRNVCGIVCSKNSVGISQDVVPLVDAPSKKWQSNGIGIVDFLRGKNYLVTGATGFLAKVLVEKMLRTIPDVGKIFILIKAKDKESAMKRLKTEIIDSELFKCIEEMHGNSYKNFIMKKLIPIVGDISKPNLGMDPNDAAEIASQLHVIVNSAANTTLDERFDVALDANTIAPARLMAFAKTCKNFRIFLHVSTAFVNGERKGVISENPLRMGESIVGEKIKFSENQANVFPNLDIDFELKLVSEVIESTPENKLAEKLKILGLQRANIYGWQNAYLFTKAMGEMMIDSTRGDIPTLIIRPSIIQSTCKEPFSGWIQGNRVLDPLILLYGKGHLPAFHVDPKTVADLIPVDIVSSTILAAIGKHGIRGKPEIEVYHVGSYSTNPILYHDFFKYCYDHFSESPLMDSKGKEIKLSRMKYFNSMDDYSSYIYNESVGESGLKDDNFSDPLVRSRIELRCKKRADHAIYIAKLYEPYMFYEGWFDNENTRKLIEETSEEEKRCFEIDVSKLNWKQFINGVHIPGLKRHVMKGRMGSA